MEKFFKVAERGSNPAQEFRAGITTFLAMAYIIAVNFCSNFYKFSPR